MLTVPEAARRASRDPETVRRWIRSGRLRAQKVGTQHVIDEAEFESFVAGGALGFLPNPERLGGDPDPALSALAIRLLREDRDHGH